ncbi:hypothetical protein Ddc_16278 [Ditylenchus destructor]|nr:hypothetical protein Ddc_16278 [Ditylenchus destructor]
MITDFRVVNGDKNDGLVSGRAFDSECQTKSNISPVDSVIKPEPLSEMSECNIQKSTNDDRSNPSRNDPVIKSEPPSETSEFIANSTKTVSSIRPENGNRGSENRIVPPVSIPANSVNTFYNRGKSGDSEPTKFNGVDNAQTSYDANCLNSSSFIPVVKEEPPAEITAFDTTFRQSQDARESVHKVAQRNNEPAASTSKESCLITNRLVTKTGNGATLAVWRRPKLKVVLKSTNSNRPLHLRFLNPVLTPVRRSVNTAPVSVNTDSDNAIQRCGQLEPTSGAPKLSIKSKSIENGASIRHDRTTEQSLNEFQNKSTFSPINAVIKPEPVSEMSECNSYNTEPIASTSTQTSVKSKKSRFPNRVVHRNMDETISNVANRLSPDLASKQEGLKKKASQYQKKRTRIQYIDENVAGCARCRPFTFDTLITAVRKNKYHFFTVSRLQQEEEQNRRSISEPENEQDMEVIDEHHGNENLQRGSLTATKEMEQNQPTASAHGIQSNAEIKLIGKRPGKRTAGNETNLTEIERLRQEVEKLKAEKQEYLKTIEELQECSRISEPTYCVI